MTQHPGTTHSGTDKAQSETVALFVSDVHLQAALPRTTQAFLRFLEQHARSKVKQLYVLGDLFEYWAGDDDIDDPCHRQIIDALKQVSDSGVSTYWIAGNRDFLIGREFGARTGMTLLQEPHVTTIGGQRLVLVHGDAQCTDDLAYMAFREKVRHPETQKQFLAMPLAQRKLLIASMREGSREAQSTKSYEIMDVNPDAIRSLFAQTGATVMIHGHTHRPGRHDYPDGQVRYVLPDWDCEAALPRGGWLGMDANGTVTRYDQDGRPD